jgi:hypothetical protein
MVWQAAVEVFVAAFEEDHWLNEPKEEFLNEYRALIGGGGSHD